MNIFETGGSFYSVARNKRMMTKKLRVIDPLFFLILMSRFSYCRFLFEYFSKRNVECVSFMI